MLVFCFHLNFEFDLQECFHVENQMWCVMKSNANFKVCLQTFCICVPCVVLLEWQNIEPSPVMPISIPNE